MRNDMSKRHMDAILIVNPGACNPSGICHSLVSACQEIMRAPGYTGTAEVCNDPAIKLMVHQLAYITGVTGGGSDFAREPFWDVAIKECGRICQEDLDAK